MRFQEILQLINISMNCIDYANRAKQFFLDGYNCSQAIVLAFADKLNLNRETLAKIASSFGGGMGRLREVCGTVTGMFIVIGLLKGYSDPKDYNKKSQQYAWIQELAQQFKAQNGSIVCADLLHLERKPSSFIPEQRSESYYQKRPCLELIYQAALLLANSIQEHENKENTI